MEIIFSDMDCIQVLDETVFTVLLINYFNQHDQLDKPSFRFHVHILTSCYNFFNPYGNQVVHPLKRSDHIEAIECQSSLFCVICFWNISLTHLFFKTACITYIIIQYLYTQIWRSSSKKLRQGSLKVKLTNTGIDDFYFTEREREREKYIKGF